MRIILLIKISPIIFEHVGERVYYVRTTIQKYFLYAYLLIIIAHNLLWNLNFILDKIVYLTTTALGHCHTVPLNVSRGRGYKILK